LSIKSFRRDAFLFKKRGPTPILPWLTSSRASSESTLPGFGELAILGLTLLAPLLGGLTQLWAQGTLLVLTGLLFLARPPRRSLGLAANVVFLLLIAVALSAFLPAAWFGVPEWRRTLMEEFPGQFPGTRTPQPWITLENSLLFLTALLWAYYLQCQDWSAESRRGALRFYVFGMALLAAAAAASLFSNRTVPFWAGYPGKPGAAWVYHSFFPNRNQTADVLALAGIVAYAAALDALRGKRFVQLGFLVISLAVLCLEVVWVYSRAGILLFFGGTAAWQMWSFYLSRSAQRAGLAAAGVALVLAGFFLGGGETLQRFQDKNLHELLHGNDFRVLIHHDAFQMAKATPGLGVGLGNFKALFPLSRTASVQENVILHPESDWLWFAVELGWVAVGLIAAGVVLWLRKCFPFKEGTSRYLRAAATVCVAAFILHGFVDVSAHRLGALWPALFLASIAVNAAEGPMKGGGLIAPLFRAFGLGLAGIGILWAASSNGVGVKTIPTTADVNRLRREAATFIEQGDYKDAIASSSAAIRIAPVDWTLYFQRAAAEAQLALSDRDARRDFATSRFLEPHWDQLCFQEGGLWLAAGRTDYAINAWTEAMRRSLEPAPARKVKTAPILFRQMLAAAKPDSTLRGALRLLSRRDSDCLLLFLGAADPLEFDIESLRLLREDPELRTFSEVQRRQFFKLWYERGDRYALADALESRPEFLPAAWSWLAACYASWGRYEEACKTVFKLAPAPAMPRPGPRATLEALQRDYFVNQGDVQKGVALCLEQEKEGQLDAALFTLHSVQPASPPLYFPYLQGRLWGEKGDWKEAWAALGPFLAR